MLQLLSIGISHKTAPLALRERLALTPGRARELMRNLVGDDAIHEAVALSTCNRTELHLVTGDPVTAETAVLGELSRRAGIAPTELSQRIYTAAGGESVAHLMRVAAGLDSMVVGESEILGQIKRAFALALDEQTTGPVSNRLFAAAIGAGKRVRSETSIGEGRVSVASVAVDAAEQTLGELDGRSALVIGSGEGGELMARALGTAGVAAVFIANRHLDRAIGVAEAVGGRAVRFDRLPAELSHADIAIGATGSPHALIHAPEMREVMALREGRRLLVIDTAVPRDVEPAVGEIPGVTLLDMDDLQRNVEATLTVRRSEAARAESVIAEETERFERWLATLDVVPTIAALRERGDAIAELVVRENSGRFSELSEDDRARLQAMAESVVTRMLHEPMLRLKQATAEGDGYAHLQVLRELFGLDQADSREADPDERSDAELHSLDQHRSHGEGRA